MSNRLLKHTPLQEGASPAHSGVLGKEAFVLYCCGPLPARPLFPELLHYPGSLEPEMPAGIAVSLRSFISGWSAIRDLGGLVSSEDVYDARLSRCR